MLIVIKAWPEREADYLTAICERIVQKIKRRAAPQPYTPLRSVTKILVAFLAFFLPPEHRKLNDPLHKFDGGVAMKIHLWWLTVLLTDRKHYETNLSNELSFPRKVVILIP
jgi:hypothetical protein